MELAKNGANQDNNDSDSDDDNDSVAEDPLDLLADLIRTLLQSVRNEHSTEILTLAAKAVTACLDEYTHGMPVKLLDELLLTVGQGPTTMVTNPAAAQAVAATSKKGKNKKTKALPMQIAQPNPSFVLASQVIRQTLNKTATPVAALLNGLLNKETHIYQTSSITADVEDDESESSVWNIIFHLLQVSPQILTTVIGTVSHGLQSPDARYRVTTTTLLGRLFAAPNSKLALQHHVCFREWCNRQLDVEAGVRRVVAEFSVKLLESLQASDNNSSSGTSDVLTAVDACLIRTVSSDPVVDIRLEAIHLICDLSYRKGCVSAQLLQTVGSRVSSRHKQERRDALTGLGQIYWRHYCQKRLRSVQAAGDDCDTAVVLSALHDACHLHRRRAHQRRGRRASNNNNDMDFEQDTGCDDMQEETYGWIPAKVFESAFFHDQIDPEMRSRVMQIMDDILLGSDLSSSKKMTATARSVGLAMIVDSLRDGENLLLEDGQSNAFKYLQKLLIQRASLQKTLSSYIDARASIREFEAGTLRGITPSRERGRRWIVIRCLIVLPFANHAFHSCHLHNRF